VSSPARGHDSEPKNVKGPSGNKCAILDVEAPARRGARSAHTGCM
jgi:hypothetical protein